MNGLLARLLRAGCELFWRPHVFGLRSVSAALSFYYCRFVSNDVSSTTLASLICPFSVTILL